MANSQNQNQRKKKENQPPKDSVMLFAPAVRPEHRDIKLRAIVRDPQNHLLAGIPVNFFVNNKAQIGTFITDGEGAVECVVALPKNAVTLENMVFRAETAKAASKDVPIDLARYTVAVTPGELEVFIESVEHGPGHHTYYVAVLDALSSKPITAQVAVIPPVLGAIEIDGRCRFQPFRMEVHSSGEIIDVKTEAPGRQEIDLIPPAYPKAKQQLVIYGPAYVRLKVAPDNPSGLAQFTNGFI